MYIGKRKNRHWTIKEKNEIVLLYLDNHMSANQLVDKFNMQHSRMLYSWVAQYRKFGTCVDNRGRCTKEQNTNKGRPKKYKVSYQNMSKEDLIKELEFRDELKNFIAYLNQQDKNTKL